MTILTEGRHAGGFITWEAFRDYCREVVTIATGTLEPGTVLGKITADGKYAAHDPAAVDGTETAVAVLWGKADASVCELVEESYWTIGECYGCDDAVEGCRFWPPLRAVACSKMDAPIAECFQSGLGVLCELLTELDGVDLGGQLSE